MAVIRVAFEVDTGKLFDAVAKMEGDTRPIGERLVGVLMTGEAPWRDQVAMDVYGIKLWPTDSGGA
jgi:hypothetical protein